MGEWSTANRVEAIGQSLHNQPVLTLAERTSINMFVLTLAYRAEIRFSSAEASAPSLFVCRLCVREKTSNFLLRSARGWGVCSEMSAVDAERWAAEGLHQKSDRQDGMLTLPVISPHVGLSSGDLLLLCADRAAEPRA